MFGQLHQIGPTGPDPFGDGSLKSFYEFEQNMNDSSGNGYHGTKEAGVTYNTAGTNKKVGTAGLQNIGDAANRQFTLPNDLRADETITFWMFPTPTPNQDNAFMIFEKHDDTYEFWNFYFYITSGVYGVSANVRDTTARRRYSNLAMSFGTNTWIMVGYHYKSDGTHHISINGGAFTEITSSSSVGSVAAVPSTVTKTVGQYYNNGSIQNDRNKFWMDHYRHFNRVITDSEIAQLYNETV